MEKVFESLSQDDFLNLSVPELASRFGCSRRHLTRLFHRYFGSSIGEFRTELRLIKVACLLRNPNLKIINVAEQCGFNHLGHFNALFKRRFGVSPGRWRKQIPQEDRRSAVQGPAGPTNFGRLSHKVPWSVGTSHSLAPPVACLHTGEEKPPGNGTPTPVASASSIYASQNAFELIERAES